MAKDQGMDGKVSFPYSQSKTFFKRKLKLEGAEVDRVPEPDILQKKCCFK